MTLPDQPGVEPTDPRTERIRAEALWEELGGDLCICQRADVWHWCETCQRRIQTIEEAMRRLLASPSSVERQTECRECHVRTGGGDYCYEHAPYMVFPKADGSFISDRQGRKRIYLDDLAIEAHPTPTEQETPEHLHISGTASPEEVRPVVTELLKRMAPPAAPEKETL